MKFGALEEVVFAVLGFFDNVIGWLNFVLGGAESPDEYEGYLEGLLGIKKSEEE